MVYYCVGITLHVGVHIIYVSCKYILDTCSKKKEFCRQRSSLVHHDTMATQHDAFTVWPTMSYSFV